MSCIPVNLDDFKYGGTNFSAYRMIDVDKPEVQTTSLDWSSASMAIVVCDPQVSNVIYSIVKSMVNDEMGISGVSKNHIHPQVIKIEIYMIPWCLGAWARFTVCFHNHALAHSR